MGLNLALPVVDSPRALVLAPPRPLAITLSVLDGSLVELIAGVCEGLPADVSAGGIAGEAFGSNASSLGSVFGIIVAVGCVIDAIGATGAIGAGD